jgi:CDP-diacylglycerol---glycerol-3-phosphate 3-phosphatidyltransferase
MMDVLLLPINFVVCRIIIAVVILCLYERKRPSPWFMAFFLLGFSTDDFDGILARHNHSGTVIVAILDGIADVSLFAASLVYLKKFYQDVIGVYYLKLCGLVILQLVVWGICLAKFGHISSWHTYLAKVFGLVIVVTVLVVVLFRKGFLINVLLVVGMMYVIDDVTITMIMPYWRVSVPSVIDAVNFSREYRLKNPTVSKKPLRTHTPGSLRRI